MFGKSSLSCTLASVLASSLHEGAMDKAPYFLRVGTMDSIKSLNKENGPGVPVVVDEFTPRAYSSKLDVDSLKKLLDVADASDLQCRYFNAQFAPRQPRIFSSNKRNPEEWFPGLPSSLSTLTANGIRELVTKHSDETAIIRRAAFCIVDRHLVPTTVSDQYRAKEQAATAKRIRAFLGQSVKDKQD